MRDAKTYFAVVASFGGYALDAYPEERAACVREFGKHIIGEFPAMDEALDAVCAATRWRGHRARRKESVE